VLQKKLLCNTALFKQMYVQQLPKVHIIIHRTRQNCQHIPRPRTAYSKQLVTQTRFYSTE